MSDRSYAGKRRGAEKVERRESTPYVVCDMPSPLALIGQDQSNTVLLHLRDFDVIATPLRTPETGQSWTPENRLVR
jgi:hypothetical protein